MSPSMNHHRLDTDPSTQPFIPHPAAKRHLTTLEETIVVAPAEDST